VRLASGGKLLARRVTPALRKEIIEQLWIVTACVVDGRYFAAGEVTPYAHESDLPESLKGLVARGDEDFYHPSQRDIYQGNLLGQSLALFSRVRLTRSGCSDKLRRRPQVCKNNPGRLRRPRQQTNSPRK
jgi:hypothetical protein